MMYLIFNNTKAIRRGQPWFITINRQISLIPPLLVKVLLAMGFYLVLARAMKIACYTEKSEWSRDLQLPLRLHEILLSASTRTDLYAQHVFWIHSECLFFFWWSGAILARTKVWDCQADILPNRRCCMIKYVGCSLILRLNIIINVTVVMLGNCYWITRADTLQ